MVESRVAMDCATVEAEPLALQLDVFPLKRFVALRVSLNGLQLAYGLLVAGSARFIHRESPAAALAFQ